MGKEVMVVDHNQTHNKRWEVEQCPQMISRGCNNSLKMIPEEPICKWEVEDKVHRQDIHSIKVHHLVTLKTKATCHPVESEVLLPLDILNIVAHHQHKEDILLKPRRQTHSCSAILTR